MVQTGIVMIGAGFAGMLLFAVGAKGSLAALIVTYFTPLPIMIAALGWGHLVGLGAALLGIFVVGAFLHPVLGLIYGAAFALPAWWLSYLGLLARFAPGASMADRGIERQWYPLGRLVLWAGVIGAAVPIGGVLMVSTTSAGFELATHSVASQMVPLLDGLLRQQKNLPGGITAEDIATVILRVMPIVASAWLTQLLLLNLWLAARTVQLSHRLLRPWPNLPENLRLPRFLLVVFPLALAGTVVLDDGYAGLFSTIIAASLGTLLVLQGLSVIHALTRRHRARVAILTAVYALLLLLMPWSAILIALFGLLDLAISLRDRIAAAPPSPAP